VARTLLVMLGLMLLGNLSAQDQKTELPSLALRPFQGVSEFAVIIDYSDLPDSLKAAKPLVEAEIQRCLSASPKLRRAIVNPPSTKPPFCSLWIGIRIKCGDSSACAAAVSVTFQQSVRSLTRERTQFPAPTWIRQDLLIEPQPELLSKTRETLSVLLNLFMDDFLKANP
jgi:hypothetical protein